MKKLVFALGISSIGLALACGHLYRLLQAERIRTDALQSEVAAAREPVELPAARAEGLALEDEMDRDVVAPEPPAVSGREALSEAAVAAATQRQAQRRAQLQQQWSDPEFRARALSRATAQVRRRNPDVASALGMDASREDAFVDLLARQQLQMQEAREALRFASDTDRQSLRDQINAMAETHEQELAAYLGQSRYEDYRAYSRQIPEHLQLRALRARLDASNSLTAAQSARLIDAMAQERDSYLQRMKSIEGYGGHAQQYPVEIVTSNRDPAARVRFAEEQIARTQEFMGRVRMRAGDVLNAEQMRRFDELQDEQLVQVHARVERLRNQANRRARRTAP